MRFRWNNDWAATLGTQERINIARRVMCELMEADLSDTTKNRTKREIQLLHNGYKCPNPIAEETYVLDLKPSISDKEFPILMSYDARKRYNCPRSVPWEFVAPHEDQALVNHRQSLERLAERGGLDPLELLCVLDGKHWREIGLGSKRATVSQVKSAIDEIVRRLDAWQNETQAPQNFHSGSQTFPT
jgi:hypothetical protein